MASPLISSLPTLLSFPFLLLLHDLTVKKVTPNLVCSCSLVFSLSHHSSKIVYVACGLVGFGLGFGFCTSVVPSRVPPTPPTPPAPMVLVLSPSYEDGILLLQLGTLNCCQASTYILKRKTYCLFNKWFLCPILLS